MEKSNPVAGTSPVITPQMKVGEFLDFFPELEDILIDLSPVFQKLKNPVLRRTIGRVATFQQVAVVGKVALDTIINTLRNAAGQNQTDKIMSTNNHLNEKPVWFDESAICETLDAREMLQSGQHPLAEVLTRTSKLQSGQIFELITPFTPMPLIEKVTTQGLEAYVLTISESETQTFFYKG